jgi:hypothetical protein
MLLDNGNSWKSLKFFSIAAGLRVREIAKHCG